MEKPTLEGEMIHLRPIRADDAPAMWDMVNDPEGMRTTGTTTVFTRAQIDAWCATVSGMDGRIDLASAPGQGTRFRVTLPVSAVATK